MTLSLGLSLLSAAVVASCLLLFVVDVAGTVTPGETFGCGAGANFAHVSPILCPVAKIRVCWNVTGTDAGKELVLRAEAAVTGYASLGLMDRSFLGPVDLFTVFVDEAGQPRVLDQHIDGFTPWVHTDIENDAQQDLVVVEGVAAPATAHARCPLQLVGCNDGFHARAQASIRDRAGHVGHFVALYLFLQLAPECRVLRSSSAFAAFFACQRDG